MEDKLLNNDVFFADLIEVLERETNTYQQLDSVLRKKQKSIIDGDLDKLHKCVSEEQTLVKSGLEIAQARKDLMMSFLNLVGDNPILPSLSDIISAAEEVQKIKLYNLRYELKNKVDHISKLNSENSFLLNSSISHIQGLINIFLRCDKGKPKLYNNDGVTKELDNENKILNCTI